MRRLLRLRDVAERRLGKGINDLLRRSEMITPKGIQETENSLLSSMVVTRALQYPRSSERLLLLCRNVRKKRSMLNKSPRRGGVSLREQANSKERVGFFVHQLHSCGERFWQGAHIGPLFYEDAQDDQINLIILPLGGGKSAIGALSHGDASLGDGSPI